MRGCVYLGRINLLTKPIIMNLWDLPNIVDYLAEVDGHKYGLNYSGRGFISMINGLQALVDRKAGDTDVPYVVQSVNEPVGSGDPYTVTVKPENGPAYDITLTPFKIL